MNFSPLKTHLIFNKVSGTGVVNYWLHGAHDVSVFPGDGEGASDGPENDGSEKELEAEMLDPVGDGGCSTSCIRVFSYSLTNDTNTSVEKKNINASQPLDVDEKSPIGPDEA